MAVEQARQKTEEAARRADGGIRVAEEQAQREAELARAQREQARLRAEVVVPAEAGRERITIEADAERQRQVITAQGQAEAILARMRAEAEGLRTILEGKATGYGQLVDACNASAESAASLLIIEKLAEVAGIQAQAIQDLPIEKVVIWDGGGEGSGLSNLGKRFVGVLPPMHELAKMAGLDLPEYLGRATAEHVGHEASAEGPSGATEMDASGYENIPD